MTNILTTLSTLNVVTIGAGTGQSCVLRAFQDSEVSPTAIVSTTDNGGHSGVLRRERNIPQVGDGKQCLLALAPKSRESVVFSYRFPDDDLHAGESVGNIMLAGTAQQHGIARAFEHWREKLGCRGKVFPATEANVHVQAHLVGGGLITGEWEIIKREPKTPIDRVTLSENVVGYSGAIEACSNADVIIITPGTFLTGVISALLPLGITEAIRQSSAQVIMVCNMITQHGLTDGWDVARHVRELTKYLGRHPDTVIVNNGEIPASTLLYYRNAGFETQPVIFSGSSCFTGVKFIPVNLVPEAPRETNERTGAFMKSPHLLTHSEEGLLQALTLAL